MEVSLIQEILCVTVVKLLFQPIVRFVKFPSCRMMKSELYYSCVSLFYFIIFCVTPPSLPHPLPIPFSLPLQLYIMSHWYTLIQKCVFLSVLFWSRLSYHIHVNWQIMLVDNNVVSKCHTVNHIVFSYMYTAFIITYHFKRQQMFNETDLTSLRLNVL